MERTFLMIKPDAVQRNLIGEIISRIERKGLKIVGGKFIIPTKDTVNVHYAEHTEKPFFHKLVSFLTSFDNHPGEQGTRTEIYTSTDSQKNLYSITTPENRGRELNRQ